MKFKKLAKMLIVATTQEKVPVSPSPDKAILPQLKTAVPDKSTAIDRSVLLMDDTGAVQESVSKKLSYVNLQKIRTSSFALRDVIYGLTPVRLEKLVTTLKDVVSNDPRVLEEKIRQLVDNFTNTEINTFMQSPQDTKIIAEERHSGISMGDDEGI
jgi:hypothetical protein